MNKKAILFMLAIIFLAPICYITAYAAPAAASVSSFKGTVNIYKSGGAKAFKPYNGMKIAEGDTIETKEKSSITLKSGKKTTTVGASSKVTVDSLWDSGNSKSASVTVVEGSVLNKVEDTLNVNSKDHVRTSTTIAGVRGTEYIFEYKRGEPARIKMLEGTLSYSDITDGAGIGQVESTNNERPVYISTDPVFIEENRGTYEFNPPQNELSTAEADREILRVLADDPQTKIKYPDLYEEITTILENDETTEYKDLLSAIKDIQKLTAVLREKTEQVIKDYEKPTAPPPNNEAIDDNSGNAITLAEPPIIAHVYGNDLLDSNIIGGVCVLNGTQTVVNGKFTWAETSGRIPAGRGEVKIRFIPDDSTYKPTDFTVFADIAKRPLKQIIGMPTATKTYDGSRYLPVNLINLLDLVYVDVLDGDEVTLVIGSAEFSSESIGISEFSCTDLSLGGSSGENYVLEGISSITGSGIIEER